MTTETRTYRVDLYRAHTAADLDRDHPAVLICSRRCTWLDAALFDVTVTGDDPEDCEDSFDGAKRRAVDEMRAGHGPDVFAWVGAER